MNDILFNESGLDSLITRLENTKNSMQESLNDCKEKLKQIDGDTIWKSKAQEALKEKKDKYVETFPTIIEEREKEIELLKQAKQEFMSTENVVDKNINTNISDIY